MKFAFIRDHQAEFPVEALCDVLGVSRSGFSAWRDRPPRTRARRRDRLAEAIRQAHAESRAAYGSPRVHHALKARGVPCCETTVAKLMKAQGLQARARRPYRPWTTDSRHDRPTAANTLNREFFPERRDAVWTADITYGGIQE